MHRINGKPKCSIGIVVLNVGTYIIQSKSNTISIKNNATNTFAFDSLHCFSILKLSENLQSKTIIKAGINNVNFIKTSLTAGIDNVLIHTID